jgi:fatty acid desaturase
VSDTALLRELCAAVGDLGGDLTLAERLRSGWRLVILAALLLGGSWLYWNLPLGGAAILAVLVAGVAYSLLLIATHEMVHGTLFGLQQLEQGLGCLLSWPMAWPYLTYGRLHRLHHRWNGRDRRDPERTTPLPDEWPAVNGGRRLLQRHPLPLRLLVLGGVGLILDTALKGLQLRDVDVGLAAARRWDGVGVVLLHSAMLVWALSQGMLGRYLLFWLLLERVIGAIVQFRGLVEHHGLWQPQASHLLTQLYASRSIQARPWLNALMGGLPNHSAHHAFPWIPAARLPEASQRIAAVLQHHGAPALPQVASYGQALLDLWRHRNPAQASACPPSPT